MELGPELEVTEDGLSLCHTNQQNILFGEAQQRLLHSRLKVAAQALAEATMRVSNERPALNFVVQEYRELVSREFEELDATALWSAGTGILANAVAFEPDLAWKSSRGALEPDHFALLRQTAEIHGGFILGFEEGRRLTERADQSRISAAAMEGIVSNARKVLRSLREANSFVDARTRRFLGSIEDALIEPGWQVTRAGFAAYAVTRNALIAIGKFLNWVNTTGGSLVGSVMLSQVDPNFQQTTQWVQIVLQNSQAMLTFAQPFPELNVWLNAQIDAAARDRQHH